MTKTSEAQPGRALDVAVARAMGCTIWAANSRPNGWALWDGKPTDHIYIRHSGGMREWLPHYSDPDSTYHRAALLDAVLWLAQKRVAVLVDMSAIAVVALRADTGGTVACFVRGTDLAAYALCVCRACLIASGVEEVADD